MTNDKRLRPASSTPTRKRTGGTMRTRGDCAPEHVTGTGKWREPGVPHKGWQCVDIEDLEEPCHLCEMCEVQIVRYVHTMFHPDYGTLEVGCICAGYMEQDLAGARQQETSFKQRLSRRMNWLRREWASHIVATSSSTPTTDSTSWCFQNGESWGARFLHKPTGYARFSQRPYASADAAKLAARSMQWSTTRSREKEQSHDPRRTSARVYAALSQARRQLPSVRASRQPASPGRPITITKSEPDDGDDIWTHEFCCWECFADWAAAQAGRGPRGPQGS